MNESAAQKQDFNKLVNFNSKNKKKNMAALTQKLEMNKLNLTKNRSNADSVADAPSLTLQDDTLAILHEVVGK